MTGEWRLLQS